MDERTNPTGPRATAGHPVATAPVQADLFGNAAPASATAATKGPEEWPAAPTLGAAWGAPDRPPLGAPVRPSDWSGTYARSGSRLNRADGASIHVRDTRKDRSGPTDAPRTVALGYPGGGRPPFSSGLYDRRRVGHVGPIHDDLDGHAFEDRKTGRWYRIVAVGPASYRVERTTNRRRGRKGR